MSPQKRPNRYLSLAGSGLQMGITIYIGAEIGKYLDIKYPQEKNYFTIGLTLLAVAISLFNLLKQVNRLNNFDDK